MEARQRLKSLREFQVIINISRGGLVDIEIKDTQDKGFVKQTIPSHNPAPSQSPLGDFLMLQKIRYHLRPTLLPPPSDEDNRLTYSLASL